MSMRRTLLAGPLILGALPGLVLLLSAASASAETIRLRTGRILEVQKVELLERSIRVTLVRPEGTVKVDFPFRRLDAAAFLTGPHAKALSKVQRKRLQLLARVAREFVEREKLRAAKAAAEKAAEPEPVEEPADPPPPPRRRGAGRGSEETPPPERPTSEVPPRGSYAEKRYRARVPSRRAPPRVPGRARPPVGGGVSGGSGAARGGGSSGGAAGGRGLDAR